MTLRVHPFMTHRGMGLPAPGAGLVVLTQFAALQFHEGLASLSYSGSARK